MLRQAIVALVVLSAAAPAYGQEAKLQWKFKEGDKFWLEEVAVSKQAVSVLGLAQKIDQKTTTISNFTFDKVTADSVSLTMKIENVEVNTEGGFGGQFDKIMERTKGAVLNITMTPDGKVTKVDGFQALEKQLFGADDETAKLLKGLLKEEMFTKSVDQVFGFVPNKNVNKGETWTRESAVPGPLGNFKSVSTYTYNGKGTGGEEIAVMQSMEYTVPKGDFAGAFKVVRGDLKAENAKGSIIFDAEKGKLVSATFSVLTRGNLTVDVAGQELPLEMSVDTSTTTRVHDTNPGKGG